MSDRKIVDKVKSEMNASITDAQESKSFGAMVTILANDGYIKKERILEICMDYNAFMEAQFQELAQATVMVAAVNESQKQVIEMYERGIDEVSVMMDKQSYPKN